MSSPPTSPPAVAALAVPSAPAPTARESRCGAYLLIAAAVILLAAGLRDVAAPWELGMRGANAAMYSDGAVAHTLRYGLHVTLGMPAFVMQDGDQIVRQVNWHHPPGYWLYLSLAAWLFGHHNVVLRLAQLLLFVPSLFALFALCKERLGPVPAGIAALLFASAPLVAYFGPMVMQDGAVLGFGLIAAWRFQRHVRAPSIRSWLLTALPFFVATSLDYPGYWWGPALFVLALATPPRRRAVLAVLSLFPVSLLAFTVMAVHYGLDCGGPIGFVHALLGAVRAEGGGPHVVTGPRVHAALDELLWTHGNAEVLLLAAGGAVLAIAVRTPALRTLAWLGAALLVPGVLNVATAVPHAIDHVFWSVHGFAGVAVLAAAVPLTGAQWLRGSGVRRAGGVALLACSAATVLWGVVATHEVIGGFAFVDNGTPALIQKALPHLQRCAQTMTSAPAVPQVFFGNTSVFFDIDTPEKLRIMLELGKQRQIRGVVGFVVAPQHRDTSLVQLLDTIGKRVADDGVLVYELVP